MVRTSASILSFYFDSKLNKESESAMLEKINSALEVKKNHYQILHVDVEDGKFAKFKAFTPNHVRKIKCRAKKEAHLMVIKYDDYIRDYFQEIDMFIIHNEVIKRTFPKTIEFLKKNHKFVGIAISPRTSVDEIKYLDKIDLVLVMGVEPGMPGQKFIDYSINKIKKLNELRKKNKYKYMIEVDGGINSSNSKKCTDAGADILVIGSHLFK